MKNTGKRLFALLLTLCMVTTLLPATALAAKRGAARTGAAITDANSLVSALNKIQEGSAALTSTGLVTLKKDLTLSKTEHAITVPLGVTLNVAADRTLTITADGTNTDALKAFLASEGTIQISAGGTLMLPNDQQKSEAFFGRDDNARVKITSGFLTIRDLAGAATLELNGNAEIPSNKIAYLQIADKDALDKNKGVALKIASGHTLNVKGMLRIPSGSEFDSGKDKIYFPASVTVNGRLDSTDGVLSVSAQPTMTVSAGGSMIIGKLGIVTNTKLADAMGDKPTLYDEENKITLVPGGTITVAKDSRCKNIDRIAVGSNDSRLNGTLDANGNTIYNSITTDASVIVVKPDGSYTGYPTLDGEGGALQNAKKDDTVRLLQNVMLNQSTHNTIAKGVTVVVPADLTLTVGAAAAGILKSEGVLRIEAGGTLLLPASTEPYDPEAFVGNTDGARLKLTAGALVYDIGNRLLTLTANSVADIPADKTTYLLLADGSSNVPLSAVIETGAKLTVESGGTLKAVSGSGETGSQLTVKGTLDVKGTLSVAKKASVTVESGGALVLPLMSEDAIKGTEDGTGLKGKLIFKSGAAVSYAGEALLGGENPCLTLDANSQATLVPADATLVLDSGKATVVKDLKALLVTATPVSRRSSSTVTIPLQLTITAGATLEIASGKTLSLPNDSSLSVSGALTVLGSLELHSKALFTGDASVYGTVAVFGSNGANLAASSTLTLCNTGARVLADTDIYGKVRSTGTTTAASDKSFYSISNSETHEFTQGWEYYLYYVPIITYAVNLDAFTHGTVTATPRNAVRGGTVTLTAKPDSGYVLGALTVTDTKGNDLPLTDKGDGKYTFTMPASRVTVSATFHRNTDGCAYSEYCVVNQFYDLSSDAWYHEALDYVVDKEMMNGLGGGRFSPNGTLTRAMIVQTLYNLEGQPSVSRAAFSDVPANAWYADAVSWASNRGIVDGYGNNRFGPDDPITREQMATILFRYASYKDYRVSARADLTGFTDANKLSTWAVAAMRWAVATELVGGRTGSTLAPAGTATRAEVATILMRFCESVAK